MQLGCLLVLSDPETVARRMQQDCADFCCLQFMCTLQKGGDTIAGAQLERLQVQNSMLQKVSRKLQEEVRLLRTGHTLPGHNGIDGHSLESQQESHNEEKHASSSGQELQE